MVLYTVWSSTYLAIRIAVQPGSGFPAFWMSGTRVLVAGVLVMLWARWRRESLRINRHDAALLAGSALLLWVGGNGLVTFAEQHAASGYAALLVGAIPIWVTAIEALLDRRLPSAGLVAALVTGFAGLAVLTAPVLATGSRADVVAVLALIAAPISWGCGAVLQQRRPVRLPTRVSSAYQQLFGGLALVLLALLVQEPRPAPTQVAWLAWLYLVLFGSVLAFTSFVSALQLLPTRIVMTYAYVNPVFAALLGYMILGEPITVWTVVGTVLVLAGVAGVFRTRYR
jgi:drug/metabolite transporter (DMT)-like permease